MAVKKQRRIEYLIKNRRLPQPLKMLTDFDFAFQPKLDRRLIMDHASHDLIILTLYAGVYEKTLEK